MSSTPKPAPILPQPFDWGKMSSYRTGNQPWAAYPTDYCDLFSPTDGPGIHQLLVDLAASARKSVVVNMFGYDDDDINAVLLAKSADPGVYFQMSLDKSQSGGVHEKVILSTWGADRIGTSIAIGQSIHHAISHLKVMIIDGLYVIEGSTNWSLSGEEMQDNQLGVWQNANIAATYRAILDKNHDAMLKQMAGAPHA
jgi:hypothetical protein